MTPTHRRRFLLASLLSLLTHLTALVLLLPVLAGVEALKALSRDENGTLKVALLVAVLLHLVILLPLAGVLLRPDSADISSEPIQVDLWGAAESDPEQEKTPDEILESYEPDVEIPDGQVVRVPEPDDPRPPDERRFLAERDSRVEEETVSSVRLPGIARPAPSPELKGASPQGQERPGGDAAPEIVLGPPAPPNLEERAEGARDRARSGNPALEDIDLEPGGPLMASALAGTGLDHFDDVIEGDRTAVNTRGWAFASFFNRVKEKVERHWHPDREYQRRDPLARIYGRRDRETTLLVVLNGDGSLKKAYVMTPSGVPFLDDEAREAVEQAAPFPNVPEGLKDKRDGLVKFTFHFMVQVGAQPLLRMRRY